MQPRLHSSFERGLAKAAQATNAWVITGGTDAGVMALVGRALQGSDSVNIVGITSWGVVLERENLAAVHGGAVDMPRKSPNSGNGARPASRTSLPHGRRLSSEHHLLWQEPTWSRTTRTSCSSRAARRAPRRGAARTSSASSSRSSAPLRLPAAPPLLRVSSPLRLASSPSLYPSPPLRSPGTACAAAYRACCCACRAGPARWTPSSTPSTAAAPWCSCATREASPR
jgi:hypothetical protein